MDWLLILLRLTHIVLGAAWVGMMVLNVGFLMPALQAAGPAAGAVMAELQRRKLMTVIPIIALLTILSGIGLMERVWGGMGGLMASRPGTTLLVGAILALLAFVLGIGIMRPAMLRAGALAQQLAGLQNPEERAARAAELDALRARATTVARLVTLLLVLAAAAMGVARYV